MIKEATSVPVDAARNAFIRRVTQEPIRKLAEATHKRFPRLSPDHITVGGALVEMAGTKLATWEQKKEKPRKGTLFMAVGLKAIGYGADGLDGALARAIPGRNTNFGQILDYVADRVEEAHSAQSRAKSASTRAGGIAARSAAVTCILPGLARAHTEARGRVVPEHGRNIYELCGTRMGRVGLDMIATVSPENVRTVIDLLTSTANIYSTIQRLRDGSKADGEVVLDKTKIKQAKVRIAALSTLFAVNAVGVYASSRKNR